MSKKVRKTKNMREIEPLLKVTALLMQNAMAAILFM